MTGSSEGPALGLKDSTSSAVLPNGPSDHEEGYALPDEAKNRDDPAIDPEKRQAKARDEKNSEDGDKDEDPLKVSGWRVLIQSFGTRDRYD